MHSSSSNNNNETMEKVAKFIVKVLLNQKNYKKNVSEVK